MNEILFKGADLSVYQGNVDFTKVKSQLDFVILRAGYGKLASQKDKNFEVYYKAARQAGIHVGAYWYSYAMNEAEARQEAQACLECLKGKQFDYPIYYDVEEQKQFALGKSAVSKIVRAFLEVVESAGYWVGLYSNTSALNAYIEDDIKKRYAIWVAHWGVKAPTYTGSYGVWQYTDKGSANGISGKVDLDYSYYDYPKEIKGRGLNGYNTEPNAGKRTIDAAIVVDGVTYKGTLSEE